MLAGERAIGFDRGDTVVEVIGEDFVEVDDEPCFVVWIVLFVFWCQ